MRRVAGGALQRSVAGGALQRSVAVLSTMFSTLRRGPRGLQSLQRL